MNNSSEKVQRKQQQGLIFNIQRYSIHDGPGIRTIFFFKGCQLRCPWCANPESQELGIEIGFYLNKCDWCGRCQKTCDQGAVNMDSEYRIKQDKCNLCGACVKACPKEAIAIFGELKSVDELMLKADKDWRYYQRSGGGITVSGGEPTLQNEFICFFLEKCQASGFDTAIETHGYVSWEMLREIACFTDLFLFDVKHMDSHKHKQVVGVPNEQILSNLEKLVLELKKQVAVRIPLIPGFNNDLENIKATAEMVERLNIEGNILGVHLLPYHRFGETKYKALNRCYPVKDTNSPSEQEINKLLEVFVQKGIPAQKGG